MRRTQPIARWPKPWPSPTAAIASRIRGAELRGYEGGHLFLFQDPSALPEFQAFLHAPPV